VRLRSRCHCGGGVTAEPSFERGQRFLLREISEGSGEGGEADGITALKRLDPEDLSKGRLADSGWSAEENVVAGLEELEAEELVVDALWASAERSRAFDLRAQRLQRPVM